ncbi:MAG: STAS domain-containing protein [Rhodobacteraceae bacterium]|nr:STAS domain-containing protein [Paracoccaceae bacterium]
MDVISTTQAGLLVLSIKSPRIDAAAAITFKDAVRASTNAWDGAVLLDLTEVQFIDSSGLGAIVAIKKALGKDRTMILAGLTETVAKVFKLTRMDSVFSLYDTLEMAIADQSDTPTTQVAL